jgi:hypothetical protein
VIAGEKRRRGKTQEEGAGPGRTDDEAEGGEHGDAAVRDLHVGVALRLGLVDFVVEAEQVHALRSGNLTS